MTASPAPLTRSASCSNCARYVYTPQVLVDGLDQPAWRGLKLSAVDARPHAAVQVQLSREGPRYVAEVRLSGGAARRLGGFWAVTEDGHGSQVKAGENRGATLAHDSVVRKYLTLGAWDAQPGPGVALQFSPSTPADPAHSRSVNLVLVDAASGRPVQVVGLGC
jgi:hypothetical protein